MTTLEQLQALTDDQLIEKVAVEVMGWHHEPGHPMDVRHGRTFWRTEDGRLATKNGKDWNPLTDWNHTMEVVEKMVGKADYAVLSCVSPWPDGGWMAGFLLTDREWATEQSLPMCHQPEAGFEPWDVFNGFAHGFNAHASNATRAICLAALFAVQP